MVLGFSGRFAKPGSAAYLRGMMGLRPGQNRLRNPTPPEADDPIEEALRREMERLVPSTDASSATPQPPSPATPSQQAQQPRPPEIPDPADIQMDLAANRLVGGNIPALRMSMKERQEQARNVVKASNARTIQAKIAAGQPVTMAQRMFLNRYLRELEEQSGGNPNP